MRSSWATRREAWEAAGFAVDDDGELPHRAGARAPGRPRRRQADPRVVAARRAGRPARRRHPRRRAHHRVRRAARGAGDPPERVAVHRPRGAAHAPTSRAPPRRSRRSGSRRRGERDSDTYGAPMRQVFFRLGEVILELIGQIDTAGEGDPGFFGLAITVDDLDAAGAAARRAPRPVEGRRAGGPPHRHAPPPRGGHERGHGVHDAGAAVRRSRCRRRRGWRAADQTGGRRRSPRRRSDGRSWPARRRVAVGTLWRARRPRSSRRPHRGQSQRVMAQVCLPATRSDSD